MKRIILSTALAIASASASHAAINSPSPDGYLDRARSMIDAGIYRGVADQLALADRYGLSPAQAEQAAYLRAMAAYLEGDKSDSAPIEEFLAKYPASALRPIALLRLGDHYLTTSPAMALRCYRRVEASQLAPDMAASQLYHTGYAYLKLGEFGQAAQCFAKLDNSQEFGANSAFYLGYIAYTERRFDEAKKYFGRADRSSLPGIDADYYLAQIYYTEGDYSKALATAKALLGRTGGTKAFRAESERIAGESLFHLDKQREAIPYLRRYMADVETPELSALYILGMNDYEEGRFASAVKMLEPVTASPDAMGQSAYYYIGCALAAEGDAPAALLAFDQASRLTFDDEVREAAYYNYAATKFGGATVPFESSAGTFEEFLRLYPDGRYAPLVQDYLVSGYLAEGDYDAALASIRRMHAPSEAVMAYMPRIQYGLGSRELATGNIRKAYEYFKGAAETPNLDRTVARQALLGLAQTEYRLEQYDSAATHLNKFLSESSASEPNRPLAFYDLGYAYYAQKDYPAAAKAFRSFIDRPGSTGVVAEADALCRLADISFYGRDFATAAKYYGDAAARRPEAADYPTFQMALMHGYQRDHTGKIKGLEDLMSRFPTSSLVPDALLEMAQSRIQLRQYDKAVAAYRDLIARYPSTEQARKGMLQMAMTQLAAADRTGAISSYRSVISQYPTSEEASVAADELKRLAAEDGTLAEFASWLASVENGPRMQVGEADRLTFEAAEQAFLDTESPARIKAYLADFPDGAYRLQALEYLMLYADDHGRADDAFAYATTIVEKYPDSRAAESALIIKAETEYERGRGADALATWAALEKSASSPAALNAARTGIMRVAIDLGEYQRALDAADALLSSSTLGTENRSEVIFCRGIALDRLGRSSEAIKQWSEIADDTDDLFGAKSAYYKAQSLKDSGRLDEAEKQVNALIDSATPHTYWLARAFILLSDIYSARGKSFEAREYLRSLRQNYPGSEIDIFEMIDSRLK